MWLLAFAWKLTAGAVGRVKELTEERVVRFDSLDLLSGRQIVYAEADE